MQVPVSSEYSTWQLTRVWHIASYFVSVEFFVKAVPRFKRANMIERRRISHPFQNLLIRDEVDIWQAQDVVNEFLKQSIALVNA